MPVTLNIGPPAFGSDGTDPDVPFVKNVIWNIVP